MPDEELNRHLAKEELALHCRRRTRGEETTIRLLEQLLQELAGSGGNDSLGVPLIDTERMEYIWRVQRKHVKWIQDPSGVALVEIYLLEGLNRWNQDRAVASLSSGPSTLRSYTGNLVHCVNKNYEKLFGRTVVPAFCPPARYTGELLAVQYLLRQTGQALQNMQPDSEEMAVLLEELDVEEDMERDEGFCDLTEDPTVLDVEVLHPPRSSPQASGSSIQAPGSSALATGSSALAPGSSALAPGSSALAPGSSALAPGSSALAPGSSPLAPGSSALAPGSSALAPGSSALAPGSSALASGSPALGSGSSTLGSGSPILASSSTTMVSGSPGDVGATCGDEDEEMNLDDQDKQRVVYAARHQKRLLSGKFRTPKKPTRTPGVESTTRCVLGASSAPAQRPDCCRLVKAIFIRLCDIHTSPKKKGKAATSRWSLIIEDYRRIRQLVVGNSTVMEGTTLQLAAVNQFTLIKWHNEREKQQELSVLLQGTVLPPPLPEAEDPLQVARTLPAEAVPPRDAHQYELPESTAGQARQRSSAAGPRSIRPKRPVDRQLFSSPPAPGPSPQLKTHLVPSAPVFQVVPILQTVPMHWPVPVLQHGAVDQGTTTEPPRRGCTGELWRLIRARNMGSSAQVRLGTASIGVGYSALKLRLCLKRSGYRT
ncbi:hypothetical protein SKAU_G00212190 [Synaphobranchus kaupii]|uniref:Uncharacterized protein n=1 Tax=Synaphobranchus kaupii TaxID=118154 RepID=A0A9Q1F9A5_SYNKA|nr:hypothetical protein SKAU_G00212190 [Synaphobranchus kaupii]